ncbi:hypothetical protein [Helicobacter sp. 23-1045]
MLLDSALFTRIAESNAKNTHPLTPSARKGEVFRFCVTNNRSSCGSLKSKKRPARKYRAMDLWVFKHENAR